MSICKRVITLVVVFMVLLSCLVSPASAETTYGSVINLMSPTNDYSVSVSDGNLVSSNANVFSFQVSSSAVIKWNTEVSPAVHEIHILLHANVSLPYLSVQINGIDRTFVKKTVDGTDNYLTISTPNTVVESITLAFGWTDGITGKIAVTSAFGYYDEFCALSSAMMYTQDLLFMVDTDTFYRTAYENMKDNSLPAKAINHITDYASEPVDPLLNGLVWIYNYKDDLPFDRPESITYSLTTCGSIDESELSFYIMNEAGKPTVVLPASKVSTIQRSTSAYFGSDNMQWPLYTYTITVDTSEHDLNYNYGFALHFWIEPVDIYYEQWTGWYFQLQSIVARPVQSGVPWYARFGKWINSGFDRVVEALSGSKKAGALSSANSAMNQSANQIAAAGQALDNSSKPNIDTDSLFSGVMDFDPVGLTVLSCITSNPMVTHMLVVVFTFCLAGYIFFGKKR